MRDFKLDNFYKMYFKFDYLLLIRGLNLIVREYLLYVVKF